MSEPAPSDESEHSPVWREMLNYVAQQHRDRIVHLRVALLLIDTIVPEKYRFKFQEVMQASLQSSQRVLENLKLELGDLELPSKLVTLDDEAVTKHALIFLREFCWQFSRDGWFK